jgi:hypothetical protein
MTDQVTTNDILDFLKENMMTKDESLETFETKQEAFDSESRVLESVDRFAKLHETLDQELLMLRSKYNRLEERLEQIEYKLGLTAT